MYHEIMCYVKSRNELRYMNKPEEGWYHEVRNLDMLVEGFVFQSIGNSQSNLRHFIRDFYADWRDRDFYRVFAETNAGKLMVNPETMILDRHHTPYHWQKYEQFDDVQTLDDAMQLAYKGIMNSPDRSEKDNLRHVECIAAFYDKYVQATDKMKFLYCINCKNRIDELNVSNIKQLLYPGRRYMKGLKNPYAKVDYIRLQMPNPSWTGMYSVYLVFHESQDSSWGYQLTVIIELEDELITKSFDFGLSKKYGMFAVDENDPLSASVFKENYRQFWNETKSIHPDLAVSLDIYYL